MTVNRGLNKRRKGRPESGGASLHLLLDEGYPALAGRVRGVRLIDELPLNRPGESSRVGLEFSNFPSHFGNFGDPNGN